MAKKKAASSANDPSGFNSIGAIRHEFGEGVAISGIQLMDTEREIISVGSPKLDAAMGGGFLRGTIMTIEGESQAGKTTLSLQAAGEWQEAGGKVAYGNAENRLEKRDLTSIPKLRPEELIIIQSSPGKILDCQAYLTIFKKLLSEEQNLLLIIDSVSILADQKEMTEKVGTEVRGGTGKLISAFCRTMAPVIKVNGNGVIAIAHWYANVSGYGKKRFTQMSSKLTYQRSYSIVAEGFKYWFPGQSDVVDEEKEEKDSKKNKVPPIGQKVDWLVAKSPLSPPNRRTSGWIKYGIGIDQTKELLDVAGELALIEHGGSWFTLSYQDKPKKIQGMDALYEYFEENPDQLEALRDAIASLTGD